jgi:hypothetical protein
VFKGQEEKCLCRIPSKNVGYNCNGSGRDLYIFRTNGGFYPDQPVAAYQKTFENQLRIGWEKQPTNQWNMERAKRSLIRRRMDQEYTYQKKKQIYDMQLQNKQELGSINNFFQDNQPKSANPSRMTHKMDLTDRSARRPNSSLKKLDQEIQDTNQRPPSATPVKATLTLNSKLQKRPQTAAVNRFSSSQKREKSLHLLKNEAPIVSGKGKDPSRERIVKTYQVNLDARLSQPKIQK